jgi:hypothetical protein
LNAEAKFENGSLRKKLEIISDSMWELRINTGYWVKRRANARNALLHEFRKPEMNSTRKEHAELER